MDAKAIINNIKMRQDLDLQGCADLKKLQGYICRLERAANDLVADSCDRDGNDDHPKHYLQQSCPLVAQVMYVLDN